jgi:mRNA interferase MazF
MDFGEPDASEPGYTRPWVIVQNNLFNLSRIKTAVLCALTSNMKWANSPGNVVLEAGEANLPKPSVVLVSQMMTVDKSQLGEYLGTLSRTRIHQIANGIRILTEPREIE